MSQPAIVNDSHVIELFDPRGTTPQIPQSETLPGVTIDWKPARKQQAKPDALSTGSLIKDLKSRLKAVERGIKERKRLERERDQINRLLVAAKLEKKTVRTLRQPEATGDNK